MDAQAVSADNFSGYMDSAVSKKGGDILLSKVKGGYLAEAHTKKGEALLKTAPQAKAAAKEQLKERELLWESNQKAMRKHQLKGSPADFPDLLKRNYEHPIWKERADLCLSCGACNIVCPTCYCFDVQDEPEWDLKCAERCRSWDGCQLKDFALVTGGHNFRKNPVERFRHRFYHKGAYISDLLGESACVGCGRCVAACVTKIANPVEVFNKLWGE
jgi:ferredoxin